MVLADDVREFRAGCSALGIAPGPGQVEQFEIYYSELALWNSRFNLTAITSREGVFTRHFLDSLSLWLALRELPAGANVTLLDIGSGAGFPGLPLKIIFDQINIVLLEATGKKVKFLEYIVPRLGLSGVEVILGRSEEMAHLPRHRESYDVVVARALAALPALAELSLPFCRVGGIFVAMKKGEIKPEMMAAEKAVRLMGGSFRRQLKVDLPGLEDGRSLVIYNKRASTPGGYPRRSGLPAKCPLI